ncbi:MAG: TetR/AcrR family transcriptional regulator [Acidimicrobiia bacterium]
MTLRERQADLTRTAIVEAAADLFLEGDTMAFAMQEIADRAGVSARTIYRHYANRSELINALGRHLDEKFLEASDQDDNLPADFDSLVEEYARGSIHHGFANRAFVRKSLLFSVDGGDWYTRRDDHLWQLFRRAFPGLPEDEARGDFAVFRHIVASTSPILVGERFGLEDEQLLDAVERAATALIEAVADRDRAAAQIAEPVQPAEDTSEGVQ